jgi:hypothetical protein
MPSIFDDPEAYAFSSQTEEDERKKIGLQSLLGGLGGLLQAPVDYVKERATALATDPIGDMKRTLQGTIDRGNQRRQLQQLAYGDPQNPSRVTDQPAADQLAQDYMDMVSDFMPLGMHLPHLPKSPNPLVGSRFEREFMGGLADKNILRPEDIQGSSVLFTPWDSTSRNQLVKSISDVELPQGILTTGGQDFARDLAHIADNVGGASNKSIAKRVMDRALNAQKENLVKGGTGKVYMMPITMGQRAEDFSTMPTDIMLGLIDRAGLSKNVIDSIDGRIRGMAKINKDTKEKSYPFAGFTGIMTEKGRNQLAGADKIVSPTGKKGGTSGDLRKAFADTMRLKQNQEAAQFNVEDLVTAITDPSLLNVPKGYAGNTLVEMMPNRGLLASTHPAYDTDFPGLYAGSFGKNLKAEDIAKERYEAIAQEMAGRKGSLRNNVLGALEKRKENVGEFMDARAVDELSRLLGL